MVWEVGSPGWSQQLAYLPGLSTWFTRVVSELGSPGWFENLVLPAGLKTLGIPPHRSLHLLPPCPASAASHVVATCLLRFGYVFVTLWPMLETCLARFCYVSTTVFAICVVRLWTSSDPFLDHFSKMFGPCSDYF